MSIPAAVFKAKCLKLMDEVAAQPKSQFGYMRNTVTIKHDIVAPTHARAC